MFLLYSGLGVVRFDLTSSLNFDLCIEVILKKSSIFLDENSSLGSFGVLKWLLLNTERFLFECDLLLPKWLDCDYVEAGAFFFIWTTN